MIKSQFPMELFEKLHVNNPFVKKITVFGWEPNSTYEYDLCTSVNKYLFEPLNITESLIEEGKLNRPGHIKTSTNYITIHDTGSASITAHAIAHDKYVRGGGNGTSWHYTVGNDGIFHHIPNNEVAYHAGDGGRTFNLTNTEVKVTNKNPNITISDDGYFEIEKIKTKIFAPKNDANEFLTNQNLTDSGVRLVDKNGIWYIGETYWSKFYNKIGNTGGNRNSIGIESCINKGSDIYLTWQRLAKLVAYLLEEQGLGIDSIVQHNFFSGKDCPMTMRHADMWKHFLELVEAELQIRSFLKDFTISFESHSEYIDQNGRIINLPEKESNASYTIKIKDKNGFEEKQTFNLILPSKLKA